MITIVIVACFLLGFILLDFVPQRASMPKRVQAIYLICMAAAGFYLCMSALQKSLPSPLEPLVNWMQAHFLFVK